ncbi:MAG: 16S rRNA (guanine(966)-N(2))-methyltransferase RsmD [Bryobacteraceae bacterium]
MRVIAGELRSRRIAGIPGDATRPTSDRLRETLFDILAPRIRGATFLDGYAGTGAVGIEALSRGAAHAWFLERSRAALQVLRQNLASLDLEARASVIAGPALLSLERFAASIVFLDPPYTLDREFAAALDLLGAAPPPLVIAQHSIRLAVPETVGRLRRTRVVKQGDNALSFFSPE